MKKYSIFEQATIVYMALCAGVLPARAGTQGSYMNSLGFGKAVDSVTFNGKSTSKPSSVTQNPSSAVNATTGLPPGTPSSVFCQSKGFPNYIWSIQSYVTGGATADNPELEARIEVPPSLCASYKADSTATFTGPNSGVITVNATATEGAAVWFRGLEFTGTGTPADLTDLLDHSETRFDILLRGPFDLNHDNCSALNVPFTTERGPANLYFVADGVAISTPFTITCPPPVVFSCFDQVHYPQPQITGNCKPVTITYSPTEANLPLGTTTVTATATDADGNFAQCAFQATRKSLQFDGFYAPINGTGGSCDSALRLCNKGNKIPIKFTTKCNGAVVWSQNPPAFKVFKCPNQQLVNGGFFQRVSDVWHFNFDTSGLSKATYRIVAILPDGSEQEVYIRVKGESDR